MDATDGYIAGGDNGGVVADDGFVAGLPGGGRPNRNSIDDWCSQAPVGAGDVGR